MPLINLVNETKLRSIPFGNDKPDGGNSGAPLITPNLPGVFDRNPNVGTKDFLNRGNAVLLTKSVVTDFNRLYKYFIGNIINSDYNVEFQNTNLFKRLSIAPLSNSDFRNKFNDSFLSDILGRDVTPEEINDLNQKYPLKKPVENVNYNNIDGILFTIKQNVLSRGGVFVKDDFSRLYTPASTLANAVGGPLGFHFQKEGLNPLKGLLGGYYNLGSVAAGYYSTTYDDGRKVVSVDDTGQTNLIFTNRNPIQNPNSLVKTPADETFDVQSTYFTPTGENYGKPLDINLKTDYTNITTTPSDKSSLFRNRLTLLYQTRVFPYPVENKVDYAAELYQIPRRDTTSIAKYGGGPGSFLGIGQTNIRLSGIGYGFPNENTFSEQFTNSDKANLNKTQGVFTFNQALLGNNSITRPSTNPYQFTNLAKGQDQIAGGGGIKLSDFRERINEFNVASGYGSDNVGRKPVVYVDQSVPGTPGTKITKYLPQTNYTIFNRSSTYLQDVPAVKGRQDFHSPNSSLLYDYINATSAVQRLPSIDFLRAIEELNYKDLIKFNFEIISSDPSIANELLFFRAYISSITDNYKSEWNQYKYVGRAENLYKYSSFNRDGQISFSMYAHSRAEMRFLYSKMNTLVSTTAPSYSGVGMMRGVIVRLTIGDYYNYTPVIINNITLKPNFEAGWDIDRDERGVPFKRPFDAELEASLLGSAETAIAKDPNNPQSTTITPVNTTLSTNDLFFQSGLDSITQPGRDALTTGPVLNEQRALSDGSEGTTLKDRGKWVGQLPRMIDVDMSFTVLHDFAPRLRNAQSYNIYNYIGNASSVLGTTPFQQMFSDVNAPQSVFSNTPNVGVLFKQDPRTLSLPPSNPQFNSYYNYNTNIQEDVIEGE